MSSYEGGRKCRECSGSVIDAGEELVCAGCGVVSQKLMVEVGRGGPLQAIDFTGQALGGYMGSSDLSGRDRRSTGISGAKSSYRYMKLVSDFAGREDGAVYSCAKTIERVCDLLGLPRVVVGEAIILAKRALSAPRERRFSTAAVSALSIVNACKVSGAPPVKVKDVVEAHRRMGRRVRMSDLIQLSLESGSPVAPRRPHDCIPRVAAKLSEDPHVSRSVAAAGANPVTYFFGLREGAVAALSGVPDVETAGHNPWALAATALYVSEARMAAAQARRPRVSQRDVARASGVAEYTVREQYRRIFRDLRRLAPPPVPLSR